MIDPTTIDPLPEEPDPDHGFWSQTDELAHIHRFARARRVSPNATLGGVLRRATACIEPHVVLPPTVGGYASVNLYTASAGVSGQGKGAADAAASAAVHFHDDKAVDLDADRPCIGSGEGLARLFSGGKGQPALTRAHLIVPEVKTLEALMGQTGLDPRRRTTQGLHGRSPRIQQRPEGNHHRRSSRTPTGCASASECSPRTPDSSSPARKTASRNGSCGCPPSTRTPPRNAPTRSTSSTS